MSATREVIDLARRSGGVVTTHEAAALGLSKTMVRRRIEHGIFVRIGRGLLALPGTSTRPDLMMRAAVRLLGAVVSHESAGKTHGLEPLHVSQPSVTVSHRSTHEFPDVIVHQSTDLLEEHTVEIDAMRVTTPERTIIDLAHVVPRGRLDRIIDNALAAQVVDLDDLLTLHHTLARRGKPGVKVLREILTAKTGDPEASSTELEARLRKLLRRAGLPEPVAEFKAPWLKPINGRVDLAYPGHRLVIEADSRRWHALHDAFEEDRRRDNAAQLAGWRVLRFTWRMINDDPVAVIEAVRRALESPNA